MVWVARLRRLLRTPGSRQDATAWTEQSGFARFIKECNHAPRTAGARRRLALEYLETRNALATLYVATSGNDVSDGSAAHPWLTLQHAADVVNPGDTVVVRAGNYVGFYLDRDGTATGRITFEADPGVTITQRNATTPDGINLEGADYVTIEGFNVVGMPRTGIRSVINHDVILRDNNLDQNGYWGILTGFSDNLLIENNVASRSVQQHGIYVSNSGDNPIIRNNVLWGNHANGIHMNGDISRRRRRHHQRRAGRRQRDLR